MNVSDKISVMLLNLEFDVMRSKSLKKKNKYIFTFLLTVRFTVNIKITCLFYLPFIKKKKVKIS